MNHESVVITYRVYDDSMTCHKINECIEHAKEAIQGHEYVEAEITKYSAFYEIGVTFVPKESTEYVHISSI